MPFSAPSYVPQESAWERVREIEGRNILAKTTKFSRCDDALASCFALSRAQAAMKPAPIVTKPIVWIMSEVWNRGKRQPEPGSAMLMSRPVIERTETIAEKIGGRPLAPRVLAWLATRRTNVWQIEII